MSQGTQDSRMKLADITWDLCETHVHSGGMSYLSLPCKLTCCIAHVRGKPFRQIQVLLKGNIMLRSRTYLLGHRTELTLRMVSRVQLAPWPVQLAVVSTWQCGQTLRGKDQSRLCSTLSAATRMMFMGQIVVVSKPGGTGLAKRQLEFARVGSKKAEVLLYKQRMAKTGMERKRMGSFLQLLFII